MDQVEKTTAATAVRSVVVDGCVKGEIREGEGRAELRFLDAGCQDGEFVEDGVQFVMGVGNTIAVQLQDGAFCVEEGLFVERGCVWGRGRRE